LECSLIPLQYTSELLGLDGREQVILIAERP
jgi:hypothetical protein